ncbi:MAG: NAD(P)H-dependent oxidoreductase [Acidobacteria bacterium]|nr:NAD(P)H-dependent oxidoreductase [Acidobacteriota bacterium]
MGNRLVENQVLLEGLNWRYATKAYDPTKKVSDADWATIEAAISLAPSSFGIQPYKFIVITDPETREMLKPAAYGQTPITDASHLVAFAYKKTLTDGDIEHFVERIAEVRGVGTDTLADYGNVMKGSAKRAVDGGYVETWNSRQAYIPLGFLLETTALLGIDATPMEGFDAAKFNGILGLTDYSVVVLAAVGYRDAANDWLAPLAKVRKPDGEIIVRI